MKYALHDGPTQSLSRAGEATDEKCHANVNFSWLWLPLIVYFSEASKQGKRNTMLEAEEVLSDKMETYIETSQPSLHLLYETRNIVKHTCAFVGTHSGPNTPMVSRTHVCTSIDVEES